MASLILFFIVTIITGIIIIQFMKPSHNNSEYLHPNVIIKNSKVGGKGVFANRYFHKGEIVEICPAIKTKTTSIGDKIEDYVFTLNREYYLVVLGYGSMYNHSDTPNLEYINIGEDKMKFTCIKDIKRGEEMFVSYGQHYWNLRKDLIKKI